MKDQMNKIGTTVLKAVATAAVGAMLAGGVSAQAQGGRLKVASELQQAKLLSNSMPVYPVLAKRGRIEGVVKLTATIDREGKVDKLETISGHPILEQAAVEAVKKWRYKPTVLNGETVEVVTTIEVVFKLS